MRYFVITDTHGYFKHTMTALNNAGYFSCNEPHMLIHCGDLLDRGHEALKLEAFLGEEIAKGKAIFIRGNHEDLMLDMVEALTFFGNHIYPAIKPHLSNGTFDTALQLTNFDLEHAISHPKDFLSKLKTTSFYKYIIPQSKNHFETEHYIFVHGWIPKTIDKDWHNASEQEWKDARWLNGMEEYRNSPDTKIVVCGHWNTSYGHCKFEARGPEFGPGADFTPYYDKEIIALDSCVAYSGFINCIVLDD